MKVVNRLVKIKTLEERNKNTIIQVEDQEEFLSNIGVKLKKEENLSIKSKKVQGLNDENRNYGLLSMEIKKNNLIKLNELTIINKLNINKATKKIFSNNFNKLNLNPSINLNLNLNKYLIFGRDKKPLINQYSDYKVDYYKTYDNYLNIERINKAKEYYTSMGYKSNEIIIKTNKRMIIGLGEPSVSETSIKLDHIYGVPYIPASTLKGALRDIATEKNIKGIDRLFGTENNIGELIFLDAYPMGEICLELDIINQHYKDYYRDTNKKNAPTDDMKPNIINFLTVKSGTKFKIVVFVKDDIKDDKEEQYDIKKLLEEIGEIKGIGAKSSVDYGYFEVEK